MRLLLLALILSTNSANPAPGVQKELDGKVIKIVDGDTFDLLTARNKTYRVRMNGIDSPERRQDFYKAAKDALANFIFHKTVRVQVSGHDRNDRTIGIAYLQNENINLAMVREGYAWHYRKYSRDTALAAAEMQARQLRNGFWQMKRPVPPWEYRSNKRKAATP
jgi:endonuclease YncB( thermonuclease family)